MPTQYKFNPYMFNDVTYPFTRRLHLKRVKQDIDNAILQVLPEEKSLGIDRLSTEPLTRILIKLMPEQEREVNSLKEQYQDIRKRIETPTSDEMNIIDCVIKAAEFKLNFRTPENFARHIEIELPCEIKDETLSEIAGKIAEKGVESEKLYVEQARLAYVQKNEEDTRTRIINELNKLCLEYKAHLKESILRTLKSNTSLYKECKPLDFDDIIDRVLTSPKQSQYLGKHRGLSISIEKYKMIRALELSLKEEGVDANQKLENFAGELMKDKNQELIAKHRDSKLNRFLKGVAAILINFTSVILTIPAVMLDCMTWLGGDTSGQSLRRGLWANVKEKISDIYQVKGEKFSEDAHRTLEVRPRKKG